MAFYTAPYIRKLAKEEHASIRKFVQTKGNDFRGYIDSTLPFSLYITKEELINKVVTEGSEFVKEAANLSGEPVSKIIDLILRTYERVIDDYIDLYPQVTSEQLADKLAKVNDTILTGKPTLPVIKQEFNKTFTVTNLSKRRNRVLIVSPSFRTIQTGFKKVFNKNLNLSEFSDERRNSGELDSPRSVLQAMFDGQFGKLQNLGHIEADVISSTGTEIKRGIVTPKLLSAIIELPKSVKLEPIVKRFSKETGQAETRLVIRKQFSGSKLVFEMLIEAGFLIGSIESRAANLDKAPKEARFELGKGLTKKILADKNFLPNLETSKSVNQYLVHAVLEMIKYGKVTPYSSNTTLKETTKIEVPKLTLNLPKKKNVAVKKFNIPRVSASAASLEAILRASINEEVAKNMGSGDETRVLNYRTGRFASSVEIDRVSQSRAGLVSVFYSYMENPYATFSDGGRQQYPKTRDPKLLISRSIRNIAAPIVGNRLRSIVV